MNAKLTLRLDEALIRNAKQHASSTGKSVSKLVADYFALMDGTHSLPEIRLTPKVVSLLGALADSPIADEDYRRHLEEKYQ